MALEKTFSKKDLIKSHPLFEISKEAPLFVIENKVYSIDAEEINYNVNNFNGAPLIEVGNLDELFLDRNSESIKEIKREIYEKLKTRIFGDKLENLDISQALYQDVFSKLRDEKYITNMEELLEIPEEESQVEVSPKKKSSIFKKLKNILIDNPSSNAEVNKEEDKKINLPPELEKVLIACEIEVDTIRKELDEENEIEAVSKKNKILENLLEIKGVKNPEIKKESRMMGAILENQNIAIIGEDFIALELSGKNYEPKVNLEKNKIFYLKDKLKLNKKPKEKSIREYKISEEVIFVKYGSPNNNYYCGGSYNTIPLGTKGKVSSMDREKDTLSVRFENGQGWNVHVSEIIPASGKEESVDSKLEGLLEKKLRLEVLEGEFTRQKLSEELLKQDIDLVRFKGKEKYEEGEFGFGKFDEKYYFYLKIPKFIIKSPYDSRCYLFNESKVACRVQYNSSNKEFYTPENPVLIDENSIKHPLTNSQYDHKTIKDFCIGSNSLPSTGTDKIDLMLQKLRKSREILLYGYFGTGMRPHRVLQDVSGYKILSEDEAKKSGLLICDGKRERPSRW